MRRATIAILGVALAGCIGTGPEQERYDELRAMGADDDGEEDHNPGFPCGDCHGPITGPDFQLAGTVHLSATPEARGRRGQRPGDPGIEVHVRDATGREHVAVSNSAGNFMFGDGEEGSVRVRGELVYPLEAWIVSGGTERRMETPIRRERSCASCHLCAPGDCAPSATSVGPVSVEELP